MSSNHLMQTYNRYPIELVSAEGVLVKDQNGKEYVDFLSGIAVTGFGHKHPVITEAVVKQLNQVWHTSNLFDSSGQKELALALSNASGLDKVFFSNSGTEANEAAIKFARKWGSGRYQIISALGGFHGRTYGALSATGQHKFWQGFYPLVHGFMSVPYGDIQALSAAITKETVAIMLEPIQGESGVIVPPAGYLKAVRELCDRHHILLILDEVQTGMGRTGKWFAHQWDEIRPDILTVAKGVANGLPLGATLCTDAVASAIKPGDHGSTFGGNPVSVAAANAVAGLITDDLLTSVLERGAYLKSKLKEASLPGIQSIRGLGLMAGIELKQGLSARLVAHQLQESGFLVGTSGNSVIRLLPPFTIGHSHIDGLTEALGSVLAGYEAHGVAV